MELVSVIIPTYNRDKYIEASVGSVLKQSYCNLECIVVDDHSSDRTEQIVSGIRDERVRYIKNSVNAGAASARNVGIRAAKGKYIAFNDSDDIWRENKLEKQLAYLSENKEYRVVYSAYRMHEKEISFKVPDKDREFLEGNMFDRLLRENTIGTPTLLLERAVLEDVGNFRECLGALEDYDLALRIAQKYQIGYIDQILVDAYMTGGVNSNYEKRAEALLNMIECYFKGKRERTDSLTEAFISTVIMVEKEESRKRCIEKWSSIFACSESEKELLYQYVRQRKTDYWKIQLVKKVIQNEERLKELLREEKLLLYGNGEAGRIIADLLEQYHIVPEGMIDRKEISYRNYPSYHLSNLPKGSYVIFNTLPEFIVDSKQLEKQSGHRVISALDFEQH